MAPIGCLAKPLPPFTFPCHRKFSDSPFQDVPKLHHRNMVSFPKWLLMPTLNMAASGSCKGMELLSQSSAVSSSVWGGLEGLLQIIPKSQRRHNLKFASRASRDVPYNYLHPAMIEKPSWLWRSLACLPYLLPLHGPWFNIEALYHMHPFMGNVGSLTNPFIRAMRRLPGWWWVAFNIVAVLGVIRRKECPRFFRFHVVMSFLLGTPLDVVGTVSSWMPCSVLFWCKFGMHFWTAVVFAHLFAVLECVRCAVAGTYPNIPVISEAAYMHIPYH